MRATAMASEFHPEGLITAAGGMLAAGVGAIGLWLAQRLVSKAAWKTAVDAQSNAFIDQLQEERREYQKIIAQMRSEWAEERLSAAAERAQLRGDIINLTQALDGLKRWMRSHGYPMPAENYRPAVPMTVLEQSPAGDDRDN